MSGDVFAFGPFQLVPAQRLLLDGDRPLPLGSRAFDILIALVENAGEIISKDALIARVWPDVAVDDVNLRVHIAAVRKTLRDGLSGERYISNVPGRGYSFVGAVERRGQALRPDEALPTEPARGHKLPAPLTRLIGRGDIVRVILQQLPERRLVTIAGPSGIGKTSVALAVAEVFAASCRDGAHFVDLAPSGGQHLVASALAAALGLAFHYEDPVTGLVAWLRDKQMLIVLDSCEHVIDAVAALAEALLRGAPGVSILATSLEPLRAEGEWVQRLPPLGLPPAVPALTAAEALRAPAVQLFVERAVASAGGFELADSDAPIVAEICRRLDGIALAIEFAAARVDAFGLPELARLLDDRFDVLTRGRRTALPRHRTLRATLDWSYGLLPRLEQLALSRLSVFNGAFTLAAAREVATGPEIEAAAIGHLLAGLVAKSLVNAEVGDAPVQYRLLATTQIYAREKLQQSGEFAAVARRHAEYHQKLFERAEAEWETSPTADWLATYGRHLDNLRAAVSWAFSPEGDAATGVALTGAAVPLWFELSLVDECLGWIERALAALAATPGQRERRSMQLHAALGWLQMYATERLTSSAAAWKTTLELAEQLGDIDYQLRALWAIWAQRMVRDEYREAMALATRFRNLAAQAGDAAEQLVGDRIIGFSLHFLGDQAGARENISRVLSRYVPPVSRSHTVRFHFDQRVTARIVLARVLWLQGFPDQALREVASNIEYAVSFNHTLTLANALAQAACPVALLAGDFAATARYTEMLRLHTAMPGLDVWRAYADCYDGELAIRRGDVERGLPLLRAAVDHLRRAGFVQYQTSFVLALAQALAAVGEPAAGLAGIEDALARCIANGEGWCLAELHRVRGEMLLVLEAPDPAGAEAAFLESLSVARAQHVLSWELRGATSIARLWQTARRAEARDLLGSVYDRFSEGFGTADLIAAAALRAELDRPASRSPS